jgi:hypothetical protein
MAINIIKQGIVGYNPTYVSKCPYCGTVFSYQWDDIKNNEISAWHEHHVICPNCTHEMAWNKNPMEAKPLVCENTIITVFEVTHMIPEGARAFAIRRMGYEVRLIEVDTIIPAMIPVLLIGQFEEINEIPGLGSELPSGEYGEKIQIDEYSNNQLLIVGSDFKLRWMDRSDKSQYGIIPTQVSINSPVKVIELKQEENEAK